MKAVILVAQTGQGKSTYCKNLLQQINKPKLINDVNGEYPEFKAGYLPIDEFLKKANKANNTVIVFEEATIFFSTKSNDAQMRELLVRKRHTNNFIILIFHSLRSIPLYILELCNYMVLFKTNDTENSLLRKYDGFDNIIKAYYSLQNSPDHSFVEINLI